jgi:hypothetical protein
MVKRNQIHPINQEIIMTTLHTALVLETGRVAIPARIVRTEETGYGVMLKNMALFLMAPFIGLVYAVLLPFVGLGMLAWFAARAFYASGKAHWALRAGKKMVLCAVTPVAGLAYLVALPFAGLGMLVWLGARAVMVTPV